MFLRLRPDIVHAHTPKAGLLGMLAAVVARVPVKIYHLHGLPFETAVGMRRRLLMATEWTSCHAADRVLAVSESVLKVAERSRVCPPRRGRVLGSGSINGVDSAGMFNPVRVEKAGEELRRQLQIPLTSPVVGFVGRLARDKGVEELVLAWRSIRRVPPRDLPDARGTVGRHRPD